MTPKEKARELVERFSIKANEYAEETEYKYDKQCALICVEDEEELLFEIAEEYNISDDWFESVIEAKLEDLKEVKKEINKL